jgi:hypothetical protein
MSRAWVATMYVAWRPSEGLPAWVGAWCAGRSTAPAMAPWPAAHAGSAFGDAEVIGRCRTPCRGSQDLRNGTAAWALVSGGRRSVVAVCVGSWAGRRWRLPDDDQGRLTNLAGNDIAPCAAGASAAPSENELDLLGQC